MNKSTPVVLAMVSIGVMFVIQAIVRIVIGPDDRKFFDGQKFMDQIKVGQIIDDNTINEFAPKIIEGVDKLKKWSESI